MKKVQQTKATKKSERTAVSETAPGDVVTQYVESKDAVISDDRGHYEVESVLEEAQKFIDIMTSRAAYIYGDPEANGANDRYLSELNAAAANARMSIEFMQELLEANGITSLAPVKP